MDQKPRKHLVTIEVNPDVKRWLDLQAAQRLIEGREYGERSVGAVIRDLIDAARAESEPVELAAAS